MFVPIGEEEEFHSPMFWGCRLRAENQEGSENWCLCFKNWEFYMRWIWKASPSPPININSKNLAEKWAPWRSDSLQLWAPVGGCCCWGAGESSGVTCRRDGHVPQPEAAEEGASVQGHVYPSVVFPNPRCLVSVSSSTDRRKQFLIL